MLKNQNVRYEMDVHPSMKRKVSRGVYTSFDVPQRALYQPRTLPKSFQSKSFFWVRVTVYLTALPLSGESGGIAAFTGQF